MIPYELLELVYKDCGDAKTTIEILNEFIWLVENDPRKYINRLSEEVMDFSNKNNICPLCGNNLIVEEHQESRGEYQGSNCFETMYERECSNPECSYTER